MLLAQQPRSLRALAIVKFEEKIQKVSSLPCDGGRVLRPVILTNQSSCCPNGAFDFYPSFARPLIPDELLDGRRAGSRSAGTEVWTS